MWRCTTCTRRMQTQTTITFWLDGSNPAGASGLRHAATFNTIMHDLIV